MEWTLREAVPEDIPRIEELFYEMLRSIYASDSTEGYPDGYLNRFFGGEDRIIVAQSGGKAVAYLSAEVHSENGGFLYLDDLSVSEKYRSSGIGSALISSAEEYAKERAVQKLRLHVEMSNASAIRLYERLGFRVQSSDGSRYLMQKKLGEIPMWNGKNKAVTFSYDDGVVFDRRLVDIFNRYGMKCTFNLNSGLMNEHGIWTAEQGVRIDRLTPEELPELYKGHEIAVHCVTHANLTTLGDEEVRREILEDKAALEQLFSCKIQGMAYPYGAYDSRIARIARECGIHFSRTCNDTHDFRLPQKLMTFGASAHHDWEGLDGLIEEFLNYNGNEPAALCIWGHSYEFELKDNWERIERICSSLAGKDDIFYGTNSEILLPDLN